MHNLFTLQLDQINRPIIWHCKMTSLFLKLDLTLKLPEVCLIDKKRLLVTLFLLLVSKDSHSFSISKILVSGL